MTFQDTLVGNVKTVLSGAGLGVTTFFTDMPPYTSSEQYPAVILWPMRLRERRMAGGQGAGSKDVEITLALVVMTSGATGNTDADGIAHRNLCENIVATLRITPLATLGVQRGFDEFEWDRQPPLEDDQGIAYVTFINVVCAAFVDG